MSEKLLMVRDGLLVSESHILKAEFTPNESDEGTGPGLYLTLTGVDGAEADSSFIALSGEEAQELWEYLSRRARRPRDAEH